MLIKINQLTTIDQLRHTDSVDIVGLCVATSPPPGGPFVDLETLAEIAAQRGARQIALSFKDDDGFDASFIASTLARFHVDYYEFTPVDFAKRADFLQQLDALSCVTTRKIANGFFVHVDDTGFIDEIDPYRQLIAAGVEYFQFEVNSAASRDEHLDAAAVARFDAFCNEIPVLVSDSPSELSTYPIRASQGFFFNLAFASASAQNYDFSLTSHPMSRIVRLLRTRP